MTSQLKDIIRETTQAHLDAGYMVMGQCLSAVGFVGGTLPNDARMTELPMADVANSGFVTGAALAGKRPIYVIRYQGFNWFNAAFIVNYAAKSKAIWGRPCPLLVRSIAMEGGIGPVAGSSHHSLYYRMPGLKIYAPMTPSEWQQAYNEFMEGDDVVVLSEHRGAWVVDSDDLVWPKNEAYGEPSYNVALFPISITRFAAAEAAQKLSSEGIKTAVFPIWRVKPLSFTQELVSILRWSAQLGVVIDDDYTDGIAKAIAHDLDRLAKGHCSIQAMGLKSRTAGFAARVDNLPPSADEIVQLVREYYGS